MKEKSIGKTHRPIPQHASIPPKAQRVWRSPALCHKLTGCTQPALINTPLQRGVNESWQDRFPLPNTFHPRFSALPSRLRLRFSVVYEKTTGKFMIQIRGLSV